MTASEMHNFIQLKLQEVGAFSERVFLAEEIDVFLNDSVIKFIREKLPVNSSGEPFQKFSKLDDDIVSLYKAFSTSDFTETKDALYSTFDFSFPNDYLFRVSLDVSSLVCGSSRKSKARVINREALYDVLESPYHYSSYRSPVVTIEGSKCIIHTRNSFTPVKCELAYIRRPATITNGEDYISVTQNVDCDLPVSSHNIICDRVVYAILEAVKSNRTQTNLTTNSK
jgi:hypothetical protein